MSNHIRALIEILKTLIAIGLEGFYCKCGTYPTRSIVFMLYPLRARGQVIRNRGAMYILA